MRFSTVAAAGLAATAQAAVPKRGLQDLFSGSFKLPEGITISKEDLVGPWDGPGDDEQDVYHPPHHDVVIDGCDKTKKDEWHYVHDPHPEEKHDDKYKWTTETITATETVIDCSYDEECHGGGKTVTVTIPETVTICPTPIEPPVEPTPYPQPPVVEPTPEPPVEPTPYPPVEPPVEPTPYPQPPVEEPTPEPPVEPTPYPPVEPSYPPEPPVEPPVETPVEPSHSEVPVPPPAPSPTGPSYPPVPEPPAVSESISIPVLPPTSTGPVATPTDDGSELPTAAAVPNAQRAGGALFVAALAAALF